MTIEEAGPAWAPQACTLPIVDRPLRVAEFDSLFATALSRLERLEPTRLTLTLSGGPEREAALRDLTAREAECCQFFSFTLTRIGIDAVDLEVAVPVSQVEVLDALAARAADAQASS